MPKESNLELKVGSFVLAALICLIWFIFSVNDTSVFEKGTPLKVIFSFTNGLKKSAPVRVAGVDQGMVKDLNLFFDVDERKTKVEVGLWLKNDVKIPIDSKVIVNQLGLMGEKYIEITPGIDTKRFLQPGDSLLGKDPIAQETISETILDVAQQLKEAAGGINKIVNDENNVKSLSETFENLSLLTGNINDILKNIKRGEGTVGKLLYDERLYDDLQSLTADLKENPWKLLYRPKGNKKY